MTLFAGARLRGLKGAATWWADAVSLVLEASRPPYVGTGCSVGYCLCEFWAMVGLIVVILIATAISDSLNDVRAWTLVAIIGTGYIISRGIAKAGTDHLSGRFQSRRR